MAEDGVTFTAEVALTFPDARTAKAVAAALAVDNAGAGVGQRVKGRQVLLSAKGSSAKSARETLDDWLRCAAAAEATAQGALRRDAARS